jgi:hypothetical protein
MTLRNISLALLIVLFAGCFCTVSGQCKLGHETRIEYSKIEKSGKIFLDLKQSSEIFTFKLYKLASQSIELIEEKKVSGSSLTFKHPVFSNLDNGTYLIQASWGNCQFTIGGIEGLQLKPQN